MILAFVESFSRIGVKSELALSLSALNFQKKDIRKLQFKETKKSVLSLRIHSFQTGNSVF